MIKTLDRADLLLACLHG